MIIIETKLKVLPTKCNKCRYSYLTDGSYDATRVCSVVLKNGWNPACPMKFNKEKKNWEYTKPNWCPLREVEE
jgi:hypothetical protein